MAWPNISSLWGLRSTARGDGARPVADPVPPLAPAPDLSPGQLQAHRTGSPLMLTALQAHADLATLADTYGSDKASRLPDEETCYPWIAHTYDALYEFLFPTARDSVQRVFECGIGSADENVLSNMGPKGQPGASLRMWRDFFPRAQIVGADIDPNILFQEERISTYLVDQCSPVSVEQLWEAVGPGQFDLMIDDGLHTSVAARSLFEGSIHRLAPTGWYVIEDVLLEQFPDYEAWLEAWPGPKWFAVPDGERWGLIAIRAVEPGSDQGLMHS